MINHLNKTTYGNKLWFVNYCFSYREKNIGTFLAGFPNPSALLPVGGSFSPETGSKSLWFAEGSFERVHNS
jgi:hypothetical protein